MSVGVACDSLRCLDVVPNVAPLFVGGHIVAVFEVGDGHDALAERGELVGESPRGSGIRGRCDRTGERDDERQANIIG